MSDIRRYKQLAGSSARSSSALHRRECRGVQTDCPDTYTGGRYPCPQDYRESHPAHPRTFHQSLVPPDGSRQRRDLPLELEKCPASTPEYTLPRSPVILDQLRE